MKWLQLSLYIGLCFAIWPLLVWRFIITIFLVGALIVVTMYRAIEDTTPKDDGN